MNNQICKLFNDLTNENDYTKKSYICNDISRQYQFIDSEKMKKFAFDALDFALKANNNDVITLSYRNIGASFLEVQKYGESLKYYVLALETITKGDHKSLIYINTGLGVIYEKAGQLSEAFNFHKKALAISDLANIYEDKITCLNNLSNVYSNCDNYKSAITYLKEALNILDKMDSPFKRSIVLFNLIICYLRTENLDDLEKSLLEFETLVETHNMMNRVGNVQIFWGGYYGLTKTFDLSEERFILGLKILKEENVHFMIINAYLDYAEMLEKSEQTDKARTIFLEGLAHIEENNLEEVIIAYFLKLSDFFKKQNDVMLSNRYYNKYEELTNNFNDSISSVNEYLNSIKE